MSAAVILDAKIVEFGVLAIPYVQDEVFAVSNIGIAVISFGGMPLPSIQY